MHVLRDILIAHVKINTLYIRLGDGSTKIQTVQMIEMKWVGFSFYKKYSTNNVGKIKKLVVIAGIICWHLSRLQSILQPLNATNTHVIVTPFLVYLEYNCNTILLYLTFCGTYLIGLICYILGLFSYSPIISLA